VVGEVRVVLTMLEVEEEGEELDVVEVEDA